MVIYWRETSLLHAVPADVVEHPLVERVQLPGPGHHDLAHIGQTDVVAAAVEQGYAQLLFQTADDAGETLLGNVAGLGGLTDGSRFPPPETDSADLPYA